MNSKKHKQFTESVTEILKNHGLITEDNEQARTAIYAIVQKMDRLMYESLNRAVPYDILNEIWKKYNSEGGWTIAGLADHYHLSMSTIQKIIHDEYW